MGPLETARDGGAACGGGGGWWCAVSPISSSNFSLSFFLSFFVWVLQRNRTSVFVLLLEAEEGKMEK